MRNLCAAAVVALAMPTTLAAQQAPAALAAVRGDTVVFVLTGDAPAGGFTVERRASGGEWTLLTPEPVRAYGSATAAAAVLGPELPFVMEAVQAESPEHVLRRLQGDRFRATMLSLLMPRVALVLGRSFQDATAAAGSTREYRITRLDRSGEPSGARFTQTVRIAPTAPRSPTALTAAAADGAVSLEWRYPPFRGERGDAVVGFHVYRREGAGPAVRLTTVPLARVDNAQLVYTDEVENGRSYQYDVRAVDVAGVESAPVSAAATPEDRTAPTAVAGVITQPGDGAVTVRWQAAVDADVAGYHVERAPAIEGPFTRVTTRPLATALLAFTDTAAPRADVLFYRVLALDRAGNVSAPSAAIPAVPRDRTPPAPPTALRAEAVERRLHLRWTASASSDVLGYRVYRGPDSTRLAGLLTEPHRGTELVDTGYVGGLNPGRRYTVKVVAVDHWYNESTPVFAEVQVPDDEPPPAPTGFTARNQDGRFVVANWSAANALDVARYRLVRTSDDGEQVIGEYAQRAPITTRDTTAVIGRSYRYSVIAIDSAGNRGPAALDSVHFRDFEPPAAPRRVTAARGERGVRVEWERVASRDLAGYLVFRSTLPTGVFEQLTPAPVTELEYIDASGSSGHYYTVRAVDTSTNRSSAAPPARAGS